MFGKVRTRCWIEAALAVLTAAVSVVTLVSREWIEFLFGVDPDGGSGALEWGVVAILLATSVKFSTIAFAEWKSRVAVAG